MCNFVDKINSQFIVERVLRATENGDGKRNTLTTKLSKMRVACPHCGCAGTSGVQRDPSLGEVVSPHCVRSAWTDIPVCSQLTASAGVEKWVWCTRCAGNERLLVSSVVGRPDARAVSRRVRGTLWRVCVVVSRFAVTSCISLDFVRSSCHLAHRWIKFWPTGGEDFRGWIPWHDGRIQMAGCAFRSGPSDPCAGSGTRVPHVSQDTMMGSQHRAGPCSSGRMRLHPRAGCSGLTTGRSSRTLQSHKREGAVRAAHRLAQAISFKWSCFFFCLLGHSTSASAAPNGSIAWKCCRAPVGDEACSSCPIGPQHQFPLCFKHATAWAGE